MNVGETQNLTISVSGEKLSYASSDDSIFTIDSKGKVIGVSPGSAHIIVTGTKSGKTLEIPVTVN